jgi:hypothetical protein
VARLASQTLGYHFQSDRRHRLYRRLKNLQFNPSLRVAYNVNDQGAVAAEQYAGFGGCAISFQ